jgi:site-specific recombinase XerC
MSQIAKHHVKVSADELEKFKAAEANLRPEHSGMTIKNEKRLRILTNPNNIRKIIRLAFDTILAMDHSKPTVLKAVEVQSAIAVVTLLIAPIREKNLAALDIDINLHQVRDEEWFLVIPGKDVKNKQDLSFPIPKNIVDLFKIYINIYLPLLKKSPTRKLFISLNGREKKANEIGTQLPKFIKKYTGLIMNVHLFRHFAAYLYLKSNPGQYETVRQLLGHTDIKTTYRFYTKLEQEDAFRHYDDILDNFRKGDVK